NVTCNNAANGSITVTASGGVTAYNYQWSLVPSVNAPAAAGLSPGAYAVTVTDANNCTAAITGMVVTEPSALVINPAVIDESCPGHNDGSIDPQVTGSVPPYQYQWGNGVGTAINAGLNLGSYTLLVTDAHNCTATATMQVGQYPGVALSGTVTNILCFPLKNGAINITASSTFTPLSFLWSNGETSQSITGADTGFYALTVTDAHGCVDSAAYHIGNDSIFSINATPDTVTIKLGQTVNLAVEPIGSSFGFIDWGPSTALDCYDCANPVASPIQSISYLVTGTDVNGCVATDKVDITVVPNYVVYVPNAFTPNGDGVNDYFEVYGNKEAWKQFDIAVFDRWGEKVFESNDMNFKWNGQFKGKLMQPAVFVYEMHVVYLDNHTDKVFKGSVTLLR
ncbi:MAG TPA: gliding motility-associated C-terminal domain-containing protein, partial [Chitinophagales bacterium]|nr:gliding motility-associated C-terminal domain-containing protein [Chitinophagales bacterium]